MSNINLHLVGRLEEGEEEEECNYNNDILLNPLPNNSWLYNHELRKEAENDF